MDQIEATLQSVLTPVSRLLDPVMLLLSRLEFLVRQQLGQIGVPPNWVGVLITAGWVIIVLMVLRVLPGWLKLVLLLLVALLLLKGRGMLPA